MAFDINFYEEWNAISGDEFVQRNGFNLLFASEVEALSKPLRIASQDFNPFCV